MVVIALTPRIRRSRITDRENNVTCFFVTSAVPPRFVFRYRLSTLFLLLLF